MIKLLEKLLWFLILIPVVIFAALFAFKVVSFAFEVLVVMVRQAGA